MEYKRFAIGVTFASVLLGLSILMSGLSQISSSWWRIKTVEGGTHVNYYFGLYEICMMTTSERCYSFNIDGMRRFLNAHRKSELAASQISIESASRRNLRSLSCIAILLTSLGFIISLFAVWKSWRRVLPIWMPYAQFTISTFAAILGVTSIAYAFDKRNVIWFSGLHYLQSQGIATGEVSTIGSGFTLQCMYTVLGVFTMLVYVLLAYVQPDPKNDQLEYDEVIDVHKPYIVLDDSIFFTSKG